MKYYTRHLGDYARDTQHLSLLEHGVFGRLMDRYYATEEPIPAKEVYRVCGALGRAEKKAVDAILTEFFERRGEVYFNRRCQQEIERYREKSTKARESSMLGVEARRRQAEMLSNAYPTMTERSTERSPIRNPVSGIQDKEQERGTLSRRITECPNDMDAEAEYAAAEKYYGEPPSGPEFRSWVLRGVKSGVYARRQTPRPTDAECSELKLKLIHNMEAT